MPISLRYVVLRLLQIVPTFLLIMVVMFVLVRLLPGDPTSALLGERATDEAVARINAQYGLDKPILVQFGVFLASFFRGDLGDSIVNKTPVLGLILSRLPVTLFLTALAALLSVVMAVPLAFVAALRHGSGTDSAIRAGFQVGLSTPVFYLGILLLTLFAALGLVLAGVGTYGTTSYSMAQRSQEFGIRMALGARAQDVVRMVMQQGLKLTGVGFALGAMGTYALVKILISLLPPTNSPQPELLSNTKIAVTSTLAMLLLGSIGLLANYVPARRATGIDPMAAMRHD